MRDGVPKHLGFEIVDVYDASTPVDRVVYLGEKLLPFVDPNMDDPSLSIAFEGLQSSEHPKALRQAFGGRISNYAIKETFGDETVVAFWTQLGLAGLKWPVAHVSYKFKWPEDLDDYRNYVRPNLGKGDSLSTAIQLPMENAPILLYQDQENGKDRALITKEDFKFYSWLGEDPQYKQVLTHRSLVRYTSTHSGVRFERIFSWLDEKIEVEVPYQLHWAQHHDLATVNLNIFSYPKVLAPLARKEKFDVIHGNAEEAFGIGNIAARTKAAYVFTSHAPNIPTTGMLEGMLHPIQFLKSVNTYLLRQAMMQADRIVAFSQFSKDLIIKGLGSTEKVEVIPPGIESSWFEVQRNQVDSKRILFWGRIEEEKGLPELFVSLKKVTEKFADLKLTLVGEGNRLQEYKTLVTDLGLIKNVEFLGWLSDKELQSIAGELSLIHI